MMLVRLNTRHELPQLGIRQTQARLNESGIIQPRIQNTGNRQARANKTVTQPSLSLNNYPSRRAYGHRTMNDLTLEQGQRGISNAQSATSEHTQEGWSEATNAAKRGNYVVQNARSEMFSNYQARIVFSIDAIPDPQMQGQPNQVIGEPDLGNISVDIETAPSARIRYTPGSVETYIQNEGFIRHWVSYDNYDIYA